MAGDYSRFAFDPRDNYAGVLKQQGRVDLDADWNEEAALRDRRGRSQTLDMLGRCVVPESLPDAFRIVPTAPGEFRIAPGRAYVDGIQAECHGLAPFVFDPQLAEQRGTQGPPYAGQPFYPAPEPPDLLTNLPALPGRSDLVYLDVWTREVTAVEQPRLREVALEGADTTTRFQTVWQVKVLTDVGDLRCGDPLAGWTRVTAPSAGRLTVTATATPSSDDPCVIDPAGGYNGVENRLYRVEIHTPGGAGTARFKWSRDNASVTAGIEKVDGGNRITVERLGWDDVLRFQVGDWVEVLDDPTELQSKGGHMAQITAIDEANRILSVDPPIAATSSLAVAVREHHTRVRRWDQSAGVGSDGLLPVGSTAFELEDGVKVAFALDPAQPGGEFKAGDWWVFHARTADGSVEQLQQAPPRGIHHHYGRLAVVTWGDTLLTTTVQDCRTLWPPANCCTVAVRPGESIQAAIDRVPPEGGCVCLLPGLHPIDRPLLIDGRINLTLMGAGAASRVVWQPRPHGPAHDALLYVAGASRAITVRDLFMHADGPRHLVVVDEASERVTISGATLINAHRDPKEAADALLLGDACQVHALDCRLLAARGVVQADAAALAGARKAVAALRTARAPRGLPEAERRAAVVHALRASVATTLIRPLAPPAEDTTEAPAEGSDAPPDAGTAAPAEARADAPARRTADPAPDAAAPLRGLRLHRCEVHFALVGVHLLDAWEGELSDNRLGALDWEQLRRFQGPRRLFGRVSIGMALLGYYGRLDDRLAALSFCGQGAPDATDDGDGDAADAGDPTGAGDTGTQPPMRATVLRTARGIYRFDPGPATGVATGAAGSEAESGATATEDATDATDTAPETPPPAFPPGTVGVRALLAHALTVRDNVIAAESGLLCAHGRTVHVTGNRIDAGELGAGLGYAFDSELSGNTVRMPRPPPPPAEDDPATLLEALHRRWRPGQIAVGVMFTRGLRLRRNEIAAQTGVATAHRARGRAAGVQRNSVLRVMGLTRLWRVAMAIAWFFYQLFEYLSALAGTGGTGGAGGRTSAPERREAFERKAFEALLDFLAGPYIPLFVGKADVLENRLQVSRFGIFFHDIVSLGGLRIEGNRISGFRRGGIRVHPLFSVGLVRWMGESLRCALLRLLEALRRLRDALAEFQAGTTTEEGATGTADTTTSALSLILLLTARLCGPPPTGGEDEGRPPTFVDDLVDALDDFLDHVEPGWLDDLADHCYTIDRNTLSGSGDGIWSGLDGTRIAGNAVTVWPEDTVPYETILFGFTLRQHLEDQNLSNEILYAFCEAAMELDADMLAVGGSYARTWVGDNQDAEGFRDWLGTFLSEYRPWLAPASPLAAPIDALQAAQDGDPLDGLWRDVLIVMASALRGYGIALRGSDMACEDNQVHGAPACEGLAAFELSTEIDHVPTQTASAPALPAIGGIWQHSNLMGWLIDLLTLLLVADKRKQSEAYTMRLLLAVIALVSLFTLDLRRSVQVRRNRVQDALVHGVRTLGIFGQDAVIVCDNTVQDALRHGINHQDAPELELLDLMQKRPSAGV